MSAAVDATVLRVTVEDTGVGISAADLPKVGNPFFQARTAYDRKHDGTGLGLSIVKGLVMLHGGHVDIASRLGRGHQGHGAAAARLRSGAAGAQPAKVAHPSFERLVAAPELIREMQVKKSA